MLFFQIIIRALAELDAQSNLAEIDCDSDHFMGLVLFSMVAFITQQFEMRLSILRRVSKVWKKIIQSF